MEIIVVPDPHATLDAYQRWPSDPAVKTPVVVFYNQDVLRQAFLHVCQGLRVEEGGEQVDVRREVKGILFGLPANLPAEGHIQTWIHAHEPLPILETDGPAHCQYRARDKAHIQILLESKFKGLQVVGWYHSHPNIGVFLSDTDRVTVEKDFPHPQQIALVFDPVRDEAAFFVWEDGKVDQHPSREYFAPSKCLGVSIPPVDLVGVSSTVDVVEEESS